jgi:outer membrane receptor protein involved in Fe transport
MKHATKAWVAAAVILLMGTPLMAQTSGRIIGQVIDNSGAPVPGATVSATSPNLQGAISGTTDSKGEFRFLSVPPGSYKLKIDLAGFKTVEQGGVQVGLDRTVDLHFKMEVAAVVETVTVTGEAPVIDTNSSTTGVNANADLFDRIPVQRDFYAIARVAPGTQEDATGTVFYGSSGAENQYIIDGLNTTGIDVGTKGKTLNFDFVQEIEVKTGGLPAEYGRMTGGVVNVLTKSGGNQFKGSVFGFTEGGGLKSDNSTAADRPQTTTTVSDTKYKRDFGGELGGYLVKDKLWFFGAYNRVNQQVDTTVIRQLTSPGSPSIGAVVPRKINRDLFAGKLTWRLNADNTLTGSIFGDPSKSDGDQFAISGPPSTWQGTQDTGSTDITARYDGTFGSSFLVRAMYGKHKEKSVLGGPGASTIRFIDATVSPNAISGGFGAYDNQQFSRDVAKLDLTKFLGGHEVKLGGDFEKVDSLVDRFEGGAGQRVYIFRTGGVTYYRHRFYVNDRAPGYNRTNPASWTIAFPLVAAPRTKNLSAYLQDSWKLAKNFTLNLGVRWEKQDVQNRDQQSAFQLKKNWAPRLGFIWDVTKNGKSKVFASFSRFYENIPQDINIRSFGGEAQCFCYNFDSNPADIAPNSSAPRKSSLLGGSEPVDPNLKGQYIDEYLGGFEYEVAPNFALGAKFTYRKLGRVIEDFLIPASGDYFIANPSEGIGTQLAFYDGSAPASAPAAQRKNTSFELTARKRFSNNWQLLASYVWSKLEGNYDGTFQNSTGQLDPNINSAFDYADFLVNAQGHLTAERQHQLKLDGSYQLSTGPLNGLNIGLSTFWYSGLPLNAYGFSFAYNNWEYYLVPRGSLGRGPSDYEMDLHLSYPIKLGGRARLNVIADAFNVLNRQAIAQLDERYNLNSDQPCAGVPDAICNGDGGMKTQAGTLIPVGSLSNPQATAANPDYLKKGVAFTGQRSIRIGIRLSF